MGKRQPQAKPAARLGTATAVPGKDFSAEPSEPSKGWALPALARRLELWLPMRWLAVLPLLAGLACGSGGSGGSSSSCDPYCLDAPDGGADGGWWTAPVETSLPPLPAEPNAGRFTWFGAAQGLFASTIRMIDVGSDGTVWVATDSGLFARPSGAASFQELTVAEGLPSNDVASVAAAGPGAAWVGFGASDLDPMSGAIPTGTPESGLGTVPRLGPQAAIVTLGASGPTVQSIVLDQSGLTRSVFAVAADPALPGGAWFATDRGLFQRQPDGSVLGPRRPPVQSGWAFGLAVSASGQVWDGDDTQCSRLDPADPALGFWAPFAEVIDVWPGARDRISRLLLVSDGTLYLSSWANGLAIRSARGAFSFLGVKDGLPSPWVSGVRPDPDGTLWVGSLRGLGRWDPAQRSWRYYTKASGLPADVVWTLAIEPTTTGRAVWIGTTGGVARFDGP